MKKYLKLNQKGVTLVELIIGIALSSLVMAAVLTYLVMNISFSNVAQDEIIVQDQVGKAMKVISDLSLEQESYQRVSSAHIILQKGTERIVFKQVGDEVHFTNVAGETKSIGSNIDTFEITVVNEKVFNVTILGIINEGTSDEVSFELTNKIFLRN